MLLVDVHSGFNVFQATYDSQAWVCNFNAEPLVTLASLTFIVCSGLSHGYGFTCQPLILVNFHDSSDTQLGACNAKVLSHDTVNYPHSDPLH